LFFLDPFEKLIDLKIGSGVSMGRNIQSIGNEGHYL
jgi:hypothetical protein